MALFRWLFSFPSLWVFLMSLFSFECIWKIKTSPRAVACLAVSRSIPTTDNLRMRNMIAVNGSFTCHKDAELMDHLMISCTFTCSLWTSIRSWVLSNSLVSLCQSQRMGMCLAMSLYQAYVEYLFLTVLWLIWKERNTSYFEWVSSKEDFQLHKVKVQVASWVSFLPEFKGITLYCMMYGQKEVAFSVLCRSPILPIINLSLMGECCW